MISGNSSITFLEIIELYVQEKISEESAILFTIFPKNNFIGSLPKYENSIKHQKW